MCNFNGLLSGTFCNTVTRTPSGNCAKSAGTKTTWSNFACGGNVKGSNGPLITNGRCVDIMELNGVAPLKIVRISASCHIR